MKKTSQNEKLKYLFLIIQTKIRNCRFRWSSNSLQQKINNIIGILEYASFFIFPSFPRPCTATAIIRHAEKVNYNYLKGSYLPICHEGIHKPERREGSYVNVLIQNWRLLSKRTQQLTGIWLR